MDIKRLVQFLEEKTDLTVQLAHYRPASTLFRPLSKHMLVECERVHWGQHDNLITT